MIDKNDDAWINKVNDCLNILRNCTPVRTYWVAQELLVIAGGDVDLVIKAAKESSGLDQAKHMIINERFSRVENQGELNYESTDSDKEL